MTTAKNDTQTQNTHGTTQNTHGTDQHDQHHQQEPGMMSNVMDKVDQMKDKAQESIDKINKEAAQQGGMVNMVKDKVNHMMDSDHQGNQHKSGYDTSAGKKSRFSPTIKGVMIGAVAGSVLPVFGTFSGALIGGIAGKMYDRHCKTKQAHA